MEDPNQDQVFGYTYFTICRHGMSKVAHSNSCNCLEVRMYKAEEKILLFFLIND